MTTDEFARAAYPLLHEGVELLRAHAGEGDVINRYVATVEKVRAQYRAAKEAPAPAPEPSAPPAGVPVCNERCGRFVERGHEYCSEACADARRPLNPPPSDPVAVALNAPHCPKHPLSIVREAKTYPDGVTVPALSCEECDGETRREALVPIDTARSVPPGPVPETLDDLAARPSKTHAEASARAAAIVLGTPGPVAVEPVCRCGHPRAAHVNGFGQVRDCGAEGDGDFCACNLYQDATTPVAPASEPAVRPLPSTVPVPVSETLFADLTTFHRGLPVDLDVYVDRIAALEADLTAARTALIREGMERDAARAEVEQLKAKLAEAEESVSNARGWFEAGWDARPQADAIKAAVDKERKRCLAWWRWFMDNPKEQGCYRRTREGISSGEDAPGAVGKDGKR